MKRNREHNSHIKFTGHLQENLYMENDLEDATIPLLRSTSILKSLSLDIAKELRYQNKLLHGIDGDMLKTDALLFSTAKDLEIVKQRKAKISVMKYMGLFILIIVMILYFIIK